MSEINIGGSVETSGGHIAGRDIFNIAINIIQEYLPKDDTLPQELEDAFKTLKILIVTLRAWKEVHNSLDEIRSKFDSYRLSIELADKKKQVVDYKSIKRQWRPIFGAIDVFHYRVKESNLKEEAFFHSSITSYIDREDDVFMTEKKSLSLIILSKDINSHIMDTYALYSKQILSPEHEHVLQNLKRKLGVRNNWWVELTELTDELDDLITSSMYLTDKLLRSTADYLFEFSQNYFNHKEV